MSKKLSPEQQKEVCVWIAMGYGAELIVQKIKDYWGITMQRSNIYNNYIKSPRWQEEILRLRKIADEKLMEHPLYSKVARLDIILEAINEAFAWRVDKIIFSRKTGCEIARVEKKSMGLIAPLLAEAHRIIEVGKQEEVIPNNWKDIVEMAHKRARNLEKQEG